MGVIIYNGVSSEEFAIQVEHPPGYETPEKDYEVTHIPGRNGVSPRPKNYLALSSLTFVNSFPAASCFSSDVFLASKASALYLYSCGSATIGE